MDWQSDTPKLTDAEFPGTSALIRLLQARLLLLVDPAPLKAYLHVEQDIAGTLSNARVTADASYELWRRGLLLQTGMLLRNVVEASAFAVLLHHKPSINTPYRSGRFSSAMAISQAAKILGHDAPDIKRLYGQLSKDFVHIGRLHRGLLTWHIDIRKDKMPLQVVLLDLKLTYFLLEVCTEFCLYDRIAASRYWKQTASKLDFQPTPEAEKWINRFLEKDIDEVLSAMKKHDRPAVAPNVL